MANRIGKCTNYASCQLAFQNADIETDDGFVCPECGQPLQAVAAAPPPANPPNKTLLFGGIGTVVLVLVIGGLFALTRSCDRPEESDSALVEEQPAPTPVPEWTTPTPTPPPIFATPAETPTATPKPSPTVEPFPTIEPFPTVEPTEPAEEEMPAVTAVLDRNPQSDEKEKTKVEVLKRVDLIPNLKDSERDTLYERVEKAREMIKLITIPFAVGQRTLSAPAIDKLCEAAGAPQLRELMQDPTVVFVVLGFSDTQGSPEANLALSTERAETVVDSLRGNCRIMNVMQPVGMGSSEFFGADSRAENRVTEVWAVLP
jgi:outer membrane protein OmpA-like peptidoglycan-associated protein